MADAVILVTEVRPSLLAPVAGVPSLERSVMALIRGGATRVVIAVVGAAAAVERQVRASPTLTRNRAVVDVLGGAGPAGALAAAAELTGDRFVLATPDLVFDPAIVKRLVAADDQVDAWLAITAEPEPDGELARVTVDGARATAVGAGAAGAIGLARVGPALVAAARAAAPATALTELLAAQAARGELGAIDVGHALWQPVATAAGRARARRRLLRSLTKPTDGLVSKLINRRGSRIVTGLLLDSGITPNQMTLVAAVFGVVGIVLAAQGNWPQLAIGVVLVQLQSILDGCDGELARLKYHGSKLGEWLDSIVDDGMNVAYPLALGHTTAALLGSSWWWWLGVVGAAGFFVHSGVIYLDIARRHGGTGNPFAFRWWFQTEDAYMQQALAGADGGLTVVGFFHALGRRDLFLFAFMVAGLAGLPAVAVGWYAVIAAVNGGMGLAHVLAGGLRVPARP